MGRTACTELQCLYNGALYRYLIIIIIILKLTGTVSRHYELLRPEHKLLVTLQLRCCIDPAILCLF